MSSDRCVHCDGPTWPDSYCQGGECQFSALSPAPRQQPLQPATRTGASHHVTVELIADGAVARLFVNGYGVASWPANAEAPHTSATGKEYAEECARVLREALEHPRREA